MNRRVLFHIAAASVVASTAKAQVFVSQPAVRSSRSLWSVEIGALMAEPTGGFRANVREAWGVGTAVRHHFRGFEPLGLRADVALLNYGNETRRVPLSPTVNRVFVDMTTRNNIAVFSGGPELGVTRGPVRPYVFGFAGYSYFYTESSVGDHNTDGAFASSTNFSDGGLALGWGGGVSFPMRIRSAGVAIDVGARRMVNGARTYLRRGDVQDQPDGSLQFNARDTDADFWLFHIGASISLRNR